MSSLSIVIPVYNAEQTIESLCKTLIDLYGRAHSLEIVLVNDNSRDSSHLICTRLHQEFPQLITYLRLARNFGEHNAVMAGLNHATGEVCVVMDDDFQNPPEEVQHLLDEIAKGYDVVYCSYHSKRDRLWRNLGSHLNDRMANLILQKPSDLYLSSFKALNRFLVNEIIKYTGPDPYIDAIILRTTASIGKVAVRHDRRHKGRSGYTLGKLVSLWGNMVVSYSLIPLRLLGIAGSLMTLYGLYACGDYLLDLLLPTAQDPSLFDGLTTTIIFFRGFTLLAISIVGEYIGRIYLALSRDPQFVIRERFAARNRPVIASMAPRTGADTTRNHAG